MKQTWIDSGLFLFMIGDMMFCCKCYGWKKEAVKFHGRWTCVDCLPSKENPNDRPAIEKAAFGLKCYWCRNRRSVYEGESRTRIGGWICYNCLPKQATVSDEPLAASRSVVTKPLKKICNKRHVLLQSYKKHLLALSDEQVDKIYDKVNGSKDV